MKYERKGRVDARLEAVGRLRKDIEGKFIELGQLLSEIKAGLLYKVKGYTRFRDWVEQEYHLSASVANHLIRLYRVFAVEMDQDEGSLKAVGLDRLGVIVGLVDKVDAKEGLELLEKAEEMSLDELRQEVRERKEALKQKTSPTVNLRDVLVDQFMSWICDVLDCSRREVNFMLALYFGAPRRAGRDFGMKFRQEVRELERIWKQEVI